MLRKISLAGILLLLTFLGGVAYLAHHVNRFTSKLEREYEASREKLAPRILNGKLSLSKRTLYKADDTRQIWQILVGWPADREGATIAVTSDNGAHFLDDNGHEKKTTTFSENPIGPIEIIPVGGDGDFVVGGIDALDRALDFIRRDRRDAEDQNRRGSRQITQHGRDLP